MIIKYLTNTDIYKFYMQQFFWKNYRDFYGIYKFQCRNGINLNFLYDDIVKEVNHLCDLRFQDFELSYMANMKFPDGSVVFDPDYLQFLQNFKFNRDNITIAKTSKGLKTFTNGRIVDTTHFEIFILKIVQELYWKRVLSAQEYVNAEFEGMKRLIQKIEDITNYKFEHDCHIDITEFGGRRTFNTEWHNKVLRKLFNAGIVDGTSDLYLGMRNNIPVKGTMAHEYVTFFQGIDSIPLEESQFVALNKWIEFYNSNLGIALSDTLGDNKFDEDFTYSLSSLYKGTRHDSGDPILWGYYRLYDYHIKMIDTNEKTLFFSDNLNTDKLFKIHKEFNFNFHDKEKVKLAFGIGTFFTNDMGLIPLQNVMKLVNVNGNPVAKLSNVMSKAEGMYDPDHLNKLRSIVNGN